MKIDADELLQWIKDQTVFAENEQRYNRKLADRVREELRTIHNTVLREEGRISLHAALENLRASEAELRMLGRMLDQVTGQIEKEKENEANS